MSPRSMPASLLAILGAAFATALSFVAIAHAQSSGPFTSLAGAWSGSGGLLLSSGSNERIRCRAKYEVSGGGASLRLELRCASDSYKFELQGDVVFRNGEILGNWNETTRRVAGKVTGTAKGSQITVRVDGQTFAALLSLTTNGDRQSISIQAPAGSYMSEAAINLSRS